MTTTLSPSPVAISTEVRHRLRLQLAEDRKSVV